MKKKMKYVISDIIKYLYYPENEISIQDLSIYISVLIASLSLRNKYSDGKINTAYHNYHSDFKYELQLIKQRFPELIKTFNSTNDAIVKTTGVTAFEGPTITDIGSDWSVSLLTGQKQSGGTKGQLVPEFILTAGVNYLIRFTNNSNGTVDVVNAVFFYDSGAS